MKWPWKLYVLLVLGVILTVTEFGFFAPALISSKSDEGVVAGIISLVIYIPAMFYLVRALFTKNRKQEKREGN